MIQNGEKWVTNLEMSLNFSIIRFEDFIFRTMNGRNNWDLIFLLQSPIETNHMLN